MVGPGLLFLCKLEVSIFTVAFLQVLKVFMNLFIEFFLAGRSNLQGRRGIEHFLLHLLSYSQSILRNLQMYMRGTSFCRSG